MSCNNCINRLNINGTEYTIGSIGNLEEQGLYVNPNYFKNYKFAGGFAYIDFKKQGKIEDVHITEVLYKNPVVVVFWSDGTKTTSRADNGDMYNPDAGLALCVLKKLTGGDAVAQLLSTWTPDNSEYTQACDKHYKSRPIRKTLHEIRKLFHKNNKAKKSLEVKD